MVGAEILNLEQFDSADLRETAAMSAHIDHLSVPEVDPPSMKIKELKEYLRVCGVSIAGVTEKSDSSRSREAKETAEGRHQAYAPSQVEPTAPPPAAGDGGRAAAARAAAAEAEAREASASCLGRRS